MFCAGLGRAAFHDAARPGLPLSFLQHHSIFKLWEQLSALGLLKLKMPVTFGSVGDIISVSLLVKDLIDALNDSRGSKRQYEEVVRELWILDRSLLEVDLLSRTYASTPELIALCETARHVIGKCRVLVKEFTAKIKDYESAFVGGVGGTQRRIAATARKIQWQICQKDEVAKFRAQINAHTASMNMLLSTALM